MMGYGDFKLLALLAPWLGWRCRLDHPALSSLVGAIVGIALIIVTKRGWNIPIPFGPSPRGRGLLAPLLGQGPDSGLPSFDVIT